MAYWFYSFVPNSRHTLYEQIVWQNVLRYTFYSEMILALILI